MPRPYRADTRNVPHGIAGTADTRNVSHVPAAEAATPQAGPGTRLDRDDLVRQVLARNPSVAAARAAIREAQGRLSQAGAFDDPHLSYSLAPGSLFDPDIRDGHVVRLEQKLPFPGKRGLAEEAARADVSSARADADETRLELALQARRLFDAWFTVHRALAINAQHVDLLRTLQKSAAAQYTTGNASQQAPLRAEVELTHVEHQGVTLEADRQVLRARLNGLLHRPPRADLPPPPDTLALPDAPPPADALLATALRQRPELARVRARLGGAQAALALAKRQTLPDLSVMGEYNSMWMDPAHQWMVGVGIDLPLPWDRRHGQREEAAARGERLKLEEETLLDRLATEVETARLRLEEALHVAHLYRARLVPAAREEVAAARAGFVVGKSAFNALVDAERNLRAMELDAAQSLADADLRQAELDRALGQLPPSAGASR